ncbi:hypothetical protein G1H11_22600 [Phytoactinopolyspora alkaliphila]|uniref:ABM domain-containing protein n=1 Tax=Phytoactinopolyspora alkaliphila TaxID=1783498 RepID=A0A6N9YSS1_9ACTN|nr:hypothetical protein [Phytoactinopolyspora alkaliphila]NED98093.1 hypothetical protein [Phytoactinopolyspora alkaliphila]
MFGLTVRWSLEDAPKKTANELRDYVRDSSLARFTGMSELRFKTWRMRPGEWFEGTYVFATVEARDTFADEFAEKAADSPVSKTVGSPPQLQETFEVVAVAEGGAGFAAGLGSTNG